MKRWLDMTLLVLFVLSIVLVLFANENPFARHVICDGIGFCPSPWSSTFYDIGMGALISLLFYFLLVRLPERERRHRLKRSLETHYRLFKEDCISIILSKVEGSYDLEYADTLLEQKKFRDHFTEKISRSQNKWHVFLNNMDEYALHELLRAMEVFRDEIQFILNNTYIEQDEPFEFFKRMSSAIYSMKSTSMDDASLKRFSNFLWSVLAGFDLITGYRQKDIVRQMIRSI